MKHETLAEAGLSYFPCRYGTSRLFFRGPRRPLDGRHVAFVGGTETYGRFVETPFPAMVEEMIGVTCVNFGLVNASVDAFLNEPAVGAACHDAEVNVVQIMGAHNISNRFYTVHQRRNDRFLRASSVLRAIYPEVDFAEFCFTRHMLGVLMARSPERFAILRQELQAAWTARMVMFLAEIGPRTVLLWFSDNVPSDTTWEERPDPLAVEPLFITRAMMDVLRPKVRSVVMVQPSARARAQGTNGMIYGPLHAAAAANVPSPAAHQEVAVALRDALRLTFG